MYYFSYYILIKYKFYDIIRILDKSNIWEIPNGSNSIGSSSIETL